MPFQKPSPAMLVAVVALFVALGGSSYAALALPKNSVGRAQLKKNSVTSKQVEWGSLLANDFKASQRKRLRGPQGAQGGQGVQGPQGVPGTQGMQGDTGAAGPFPDGDIPSGKTMRGAFSMLGTNSDPTLSTALSFGFRLASPPATHFIRSGFPVPIQCSGTAANPEAAPGNLCIYEANGLNHGDGRVFAPQGGVVGAGRHGAVLEVDNAGSPTQAVFSYGSWAVTSP